MSPNSDEFLDYIRKVSQVGTTYINVTSEDYFVLAKLLEQEKQFPNIVVTVENPKLTEKEISDIYESINHPMYIGMNMNNGHNFRETDAETSLRSYLKEMFKYSSQIKILEIDFQILKRLCDSIDSIKGKPLKKHASLKTLVEFMQLSDFKRFLNISLSDKASAHFTEAEEEMASYLGRLNEFFAQKSFKVTEVEKEEILQTVHNILPSSDHLLIGASF